MPMVNIRENDSFDVALRRFKRSCEKAGILSKLRQIEYHEKDTTKRKRKKAAARKRELKRLKKENEALMRGRARRFNFDTVIAAEPPVTEPEEEKAEEKTTKAAKTDTDTAKTKSAEHENQDSAAAE